VPKEALLSNLVKDLNYVVFPTYAHRFLFNIFPPKPGAKILEAGCGSAKFTLAYALGGCDCWAFDIDNSVVDYATRLEKALWALIVSPYAAPPLVIPYSRPSISHGDIFNMSDEGWTDKHDLVFNEGVPQHWPEEEKRQKCIDEMVRVTKPGGTVVVMGNNGANSDEQEIDKTFKFTYEGMPPTRRCFLPGELKMMLEKAGLQDVRVSPIWPEPVDYPGWTNATLIAGWGRK